MKQEKKKNEKTNPLTFEVAGLCKKKLLHLNFVSVFRPGLSKSISSSLILKTNINLILTEDKKNLLPRFLLYFTFLYREQRKKTLGCQQTLHWRGAESPDKCKAPMKVGKGADETLVSFVVGSFGPEGGACSVVLLGSRLQPTCMIPSCIHPSRGH